MNVVLRYALVVAAGMSALMAAARTHAAYDASDDERRVKAVFLYKFAPYISWPASAWSGANAPLVIATTSPAMTQELATLVSGRQVDGRPVAVRQLREGEPPSGVHMLFVGAAQSRRLPELSQQTRGQPVLLVSETPDGLERGAVINFALADGRVRFDVLLPAAEERRLVISSRLLRVARQVKTETP